MLKTETKKKIATYLKIKEADLETAIKDEKEVDLAIPDDLEVLTKEELETRDNNQKKEGEKAGREIGIKEVKKAAGLPEDAPAKDPAKVAQAIADKATKDAKVAPDEKVTQLTEQNNLLQQKLAEKDKEIGEVKKVADTVSLDRKILAAFPKTRADVLSDDDYVDVLKKHYTFKEQDGKIIVEKDGKPLRDGKTTNPLELAEAISTIFAERKGWLTAEEETPGGRGAGDGKKAVKFSKLSEIKESFKAAGKSQLGEEFAQTVAKAAKDNPEFVMD
jgi:hypothetical protein